MAFCDDNEDIHSCMLTALSNFMRQHNIEPRDIGRLEVGTESLVDKSKSVKTILMSLFPENKVSELNHFFDFFDRPRRTWRV